MPEMIPSSDKDISLREHIEAQIAGVRRELLLIQEAQKTAVQKAEETMSKRLDSMNEFRQQLKDQAATFASRELVDKMNKDMDERLDRQERDFRSALTRVTAEQGDRITRLENKGSNLDGRFWAIGAVVIVVNLLIAVFSIAWKAGS